MGVFTVDDALRAAAIDAGHELGVYEALASPLSLAELADRTRVPPTHRFAALIDALIALGTLTRDGTRITRGSIAPRSTQPMMGGWGAIADVIRTDTPLTIGDAEIARRYQRHLVTASAPAAREVAEMLVATRSSRVIDIDRRETGDGPRCLDIGGGAGAYTRAVLVANPRARATLIDSAEVVELARSELAEHGERVQFVAGDARDIESTGAFEVTMVANVLHLHAPTACAELCATAARAIVPGGLVAIVDLRRGTLEGEMFALNMAIYTDAGSVYSVEQIGAWLRDAGLEGIEERRLASAPEMVVVLAVRPATM